MTPRLRLALVTALALGGCHFHKHARGVVTAPPARAPLALASDPKLVEMSVEATSPLILANASDELGIHVRVTAKAPPAAARPPLDLVLLLDTSGSMEGDAIAALRQSAGALVDKLRDGDRVTLVTFDSKVAEPMRGVVIDAAARARAHHAIDAIVARGTTDLQAGLGAAMSELAQRPHGKDLPRIVLLSDGVPNVSDQLPAQLASIRSYGYSVTSLGLGLDYDTTLMTRIATDTGGAFHYLEKPDQIAEVFDDELAKMTTVVARNVQLQLDAGPGVTLAPLAGYTVSGSHLYANLGDLPAGTTRDLVLPIRVAARGDGSTAELVDAHLTFTDVVANAGALARDGFVGAKATKDQAAIAANLKTDLEVARVRAAAASAILESLALARAGQIEPAKKRIAETIVAVKAAQTKLKAGGELASVLSDLASATKEISQLVMQQAEIIQPAPNGGGMKRPQAPQPAPQPAVAPPAVERDLRRMEEAATATVRGG